MLGIVMSDKTSKFYVRGQVQVRMLQRRVKRAVPITLISLFLVSLAMVISVSAIRSAIGPRRQSQGAAAILALSVFGAGVFFLAWWIIYYISTTQGWADPRVVLQLAAVYGQRKHVIPYVSYFSIVSTTSSGILHVFAGADTSPTAAKSCSCPQ